MRITNIFLKPLLFVLFVANSYWLFEMPVCISWLSTLLKFLNTFKLPSCKYKAYRKWAITRQRTCMFEGIVQPTQTLRQDQNRLKISQTCQWPVHFPLNHLFWKRVSIINLAQKEKFHLTIWLCCSVEKWMLLWQILHSCIRLGLFVTCAL